MMQNFWWLIFQFMITVMISKNISKKYEGLHRKWCRQSHVFSPYLMSIGMNEKMININLFLRYHAAKLLKIREKWIFCRNGMKKVFIIINNFSAYQKVMNYNLVKFFYIMLQKLLRYFLCCIKFFAKNKEFKYY